MTTEFTPYLSLAGGAMIGLAAVLLMLVHGRIAGATGMLSGLIRFDSIPEWSWRAAMIAGMVLAPVLALLLAGRATTVEVPVGTLALVIGGFLVGLGASMGNGCTSGHGVCGMARGSMRSILATLTFMATCAATVFILRHVIGG